jgi:putative aldouronate transport system substrate-binding protein
MKKIFLLVLGVLCLYTSMASCKNEKTSTNQLRLPTITNRLLGGEKISFPLVQEAKTFNIMATGYNGYDQEDVYVWKAYEKLTGININWTTIKKENRSQEVYNALTNNLNYDLILRCKVSSEKLYQYGTNNLILDLAKDGLLKKYAPNCWAYLQSNPDTLASIMNPDGSIYAIPQVNSGAELRVAQKIYINKKWMNRLQLAIPTTTDEFKNLLIAFRDYDANGNGDSTDEIPFCCAIWESIRMGLYGSFGLANHGFHNYTIDSDPKTGKVRFIQGSEEYRQFLEYMNELYSESLLDKYTFSMTNDRWLANINQDLVGVFINTNLASLPSNMTEDWIALDKPLEGPNGDALWSAIRANFHSTGAAIIPSTCTNPALALQWLDYFWTDEGSLFYHMGELEKTFTIKEDGSYDYLPEIYEDMQKNNLPYDDVIAKYSPYPGGSNPTVEISPYFMGGEMAKVPATAAQSLIKYGPKEYWPSFTFTKEESEKLALIQADVNKLCTTMEKNFITGVISLSEWNNYLTQLNKLQIVEMLQIYQNAVDRYHSLITILQ